jgi:FixJ family two-component response regulator
MNAVISIVDNDKSVREGLGDFFKAFGFVTAIFSRAAAFLKSDHIRDTQCLIADVQMPEMTGIELHRTLRQAGVMISTILITAYPNERDRLSVLQAGVLRYFVKPYDHDELLACVRSAIGPPEAKGEHHERIHIDDSSTLSE